MTPTKSSQPASLIPSAPHAPGLPRMRVLYAIGAPKSLGRVVCAVSAYDGVHRGHRALAERAAAWARREGVPAVAVVVWEGERSADEVTEPGASRPLLTLLDERLALLGELGLFDAALVVSRAPDAPALSAEAARAAISPWLEPVAVLADEERGDGDGGVSEDRSEHGGAGARNTVGSHIVGALLASDVRRAAELLGHPYGVAGEVVGGDRRGRVLGYPTANLRLDPRKLLPADGVYAVRARLPGESRATHAAVASLGVRPQFGEYGPRLLEVYLLDAALDLYGLTLGVEFVERLREQRRFADVEALKAQMARDVALARDLLETK